MKTHPRKRTYYVRGMHCGSCELLIENKLKKLSCIENIEISLQNNTVTFYEKKEKGSIIKDCNKALSDTGYTISEKPIGTTNWDMLTVVKAGSVLVILLALYVYVESEGLFRYASIKETSTLTAFLIFGLVAGFSSCGALVGGLLLSLSRQWNDLYAGNSLIRKSTPSLLFNIARLVSYAFFGGILGLVGGASQLSIGTTSTLVLAVSVFMVVIGLQMLGVPWVSGMRFRLPPVLISKLSKADNFQGKYMPVLAGAGTFFIPCGFTLLVQSVAFATGNFVTSALIMFVFALGTLPSLLLLSVGSITLQSNATYVGTYNMVVGILIIVFGMYNVNSQLVVLGLPNSSTIYTYVVGQNSQTNNSINADGLGVSIVNNNGKTLQKVYIRAEGFKYFPRNLTLQKGVHTTMYIYSKDVIGCAQAMYLKGLYDDVIILDKPEFEVAFVPQKGTYYISCSMGMVQPIVVTVI